MAFINLFLLLLGLSTWKHTIAKDQKLLCTLPLSCLPLKNCKSLMTAIKISQNSPATMKFLRSQVCGQHSKEEPKVCCPDKVDDHKSVKKQLSESPCKSSFVCINLPECGPLMYLLKLEKPVTPGIVKFIRTRECGAGTIYPKVCCKRLPNREANVSSTTTNTTAEGQLSHTTEKSETTASANSVFNPNIPISIHKETNIPINTSPPISDTTTTQKESSSTISLKEKSDAMNRLFNNDFLTFDFFIRRRK